MNESIFKAYDIRGLYPEQIDEDAAWKIGYAAARFLRSLGALPEWLFYRVRSDDFVADVCQGLQGVVYPAIRPHDVRNHELPVPPLPEQTRIVEAIESYFTHDVDAS